MRRTRMAAVLAAVLVLAGCATQPSAPPPALQDRGGVEGSGPDVVLDVSYVEVYRNIDHYPNIALVCVRGIGFAAPSTGAGASVGATPMLRVPDWDAFCATKEPGATPPR